MSNILIAYYSRADENYVNGQMKMLQTGNTECAAQVIADVTGGDMFHIEQLKPYSKNYNDCIHEAQVDQKQNVRPSLTEYPKSIDSYDVIYLGYPNYWGTMPMAVFTFLEHFDFTGKTIYPFCTHEGNGLGSSIKDLKQLCPSAVIATGLAIHGGSVDRHTDEIKNWCIGTK